MRSQLRSDAGRHSHAEDPLKGCRLARERRPASERSCDRIYSIPNAAFPSNSAPYLLTRRRWQVRKLNERLNHWSALADDFRTFVLSEDPVLRVEIASELFSAS